MFLEFFKSNANINYFTKIVSRCFESITSLFLFRNITADKPLLEMGDQKAHDTLERMIIEKLSIDTEESDFGKIRRNVLQCMKYKDNVSITFC